jgi:cellulose synthase/poly-beta-1,6-N-acetylglucosamine synthase-like glycosyltransferase
MSTSPDLRDLPAIPADAPVTFVVPARRAAALLAGCVTLLRAQLRDDDEIVIAAGDDDTAAAAQVLAGSEPRLRVVANPAGTTPAALNAAVAVARHPVIVRVDAQSRIPVGYRDRVVELLATTGAVNVGGRQVAEATTGRAATIAAAMNSRLGHGGAAYRSGSAGGPVDTVYLGAFRADALRGIGAFDERFTTNQDAELNERLRRAGGTVWLDPGLVVGYLPRTTLRALARQFRGYGRGRAMTARRHPGSLARRQLAAPTLVVGLLGALTLLPWTVVPLVVAVGGYGALLLLGSLLEGPAVRKRLPGVVLALVVMHLAWGYGFLTAPRPSPAHRPDSATG